MFGKTDYVAPANTYIGLFQVAPTDAQSSGTEMSAGNYARATLVNNTLNWLNATGTSPTTKTNGSVITFATASVDWGTAVAFGIFDATSGTNMLAWADLTQNKVISSGDTASFAASALTITLT